MRTSAATPSCNTRGDGGVATLMPFRHPTSCGANGGKWVANGGAEAKDRLMDDFPNDPLADFDLPDEAIAEATIITCTIDGFLEPSDITCLLRSDGAKAEQIGNLVAPSTAQRIDPKRIREKHHSVARLAAAGLPQTLIAQFSGYTQSYLSTLMASPSMQELIGHYRAQNGAAAEVIGEKLRTVGMMALDKLETKLTSEEIAVNELVAISKLGLDRSGHGPSQRIDHNHQHTVVAPEEVQRLNDLARRSSNARILPRPQVIEHAPAPAMPSPDDLP